MQNCVKSVKLVTRENAGVLPVFAILINLIVVASWNPRGNGMISKNVCKTVRTTRGRKKGSCRRGRKKKDDQKIWIDTLALVGNVAVFDENVEMVDDLFLIERSGIWSPTSGIII